MKHISVVRAVAGFFVCGFATVLGQGCDTNPGSVGGSGSGGTGRASVTFNLGLGGQTGARLRGSGGIVADAASADAPAARKDVRIEGVAPEVQGPSSKRSDGPQALDQAALLPDARPAADKAATPDLPAKEAAVRGAPPGSDARSHLDVGAPDEPPPGMDAPTRDGPAADNAAAECSYGGVAYLVGDSFPNDCNTCFWPGQSVPYSAIKVRCRRA